MMKKLLLLLTVIASFTISKSSAQCTPDVSCIPSGQGYGICPDSTTGMAQGMVGVPYTQVMSMKVPTNGADFGYSFATIVSIHIDDVTGLAPGLSYVCSPSNCTFPGGSNGCILISGTPTTVWDQQVVVNATANATIFGGATTMPQSNTQYRSVVVASTVGIESLSLSNFEVSQNSPNPFDFKTEIEFSSPSVENVDFKVFNMLGALVYSKTIKAEKGINTIDLDASNFPSGIYVYSLKNGEKTITKRMIVSSK